jgi:hypothetical protein
MTTRDTAAASVTNCGDVSFRDHAKADATLPLTLDQQISRGNLMRFVFPLMAMMVPISAHSQISVGEDQPVIVRSHYRGWDSQRLSNGLIELQIVPEIGGRVVQYKLGEMEFLWVNSQLAGKLPPPGGVGPDGAWLNYGGDKLWPAPQGWDNDQQWPGPPDAVLDGLPYAVDILGPEASIRLTSGKDSLSGVRFSRTIRIFPGSTRVRFEATMTNVDTKPRRWGIWAHTQLDAARADGQGYNSQMSAWCPLNPQSHFAKGYGVIFGADDNPSFQVDRERGLLHVSYRYQVGKIGVDSPAGWVATVDAASGAAFVQRFVFEPGKEYPDGASVEFWHNGVGKIRAYNKELIMPDDPVENPFVFESEVLSPLARLLPGETYTWHYDWYAANLGGDWPVVDCSDAGIVSERLQANLAGGQVNVRGRFGVFAPAAARLIFLGAEGSHLYVWDRPERATPLKPLVLQTTLQAPDGAVAVELVLLAADGRILGQLGKAKIEGAPAPRR